MQATRGASLIATLGSEPQVVSTALVLLQQSGFPIQNVTVIHTQGRGNAISDAAESLRSWFTSYIKKNSITVHFSLIKDNHGLPVTDVVTPTAIEAAFRKIFSEVAKAKRAMSEVHLLVAGGRKTIALFGMVSAQLLFDDRDHLWHLFSEDTFLRSKRMSPNEGDNVKLIPVPVISWSAIPNSILDLHKLDDPYQALKRQEMIQVGERTEASQRFLIDMLSPAQRDVVELAVRKSLSDREIAEELHLSIKTVGHHLSAVYAKARCFLGVENMNRNLLTNWLGFFFQLTPSQLKYDEIGRSPDDNELRS